MYYLPISGLPIVEEDEAPAEIAPIYEEIKRDFGFPFVPNFYKVMASSPAALTIHVDSYRSLVRHSTLPEALTAMIHFAIAVENECEYCSAGNELTCRTLGIDEETLTTLVEDLGNVSPKRIRAIIEFALKVAHNAKGLVAEDYDRVREHGVSDDELVEIIHIAALGTFADIMADALKVKVDEAITQALGR